MATYGHTRALKDRSVTVPRVELTFVDVTAAEPAFGRMMRDLALDVCEMAPATYLIARARGAPYIALPVFLRRRFHHGSLVYRADSGIRMPKDLEGKRVGVRAYSVTTGVWGRGILVNDYQLNASKVTWVVDSEEHVAELRLPINVMHAPPGRSLASMMAQGEIQAGFTRNTGSGRTASRGAPGYRELFGADAPELEAEWFERTGIYPFHGVVVVREDLLNAHHWLAGALFDAFCEAKARWLATAKTTVAHCAIDRKHCEQRALLGGDPLPYGLKCNRASIEAMITYAVQQGLIPRPLPIEHLFVDPRTYH